MIERLVSSPRAVDSSSAAMFLRLFVERCRLPLTFQKPNGAIPSNDDQESEPLCNSFKLDHVPCTQSFRVLSQLVDLLQAHSSTASRNLSLIGIQAPMHGVLYCLRSIISHTSLRYNQNYYRIASHRFRSMIVYNRRTAHHYRRRRAEKVSRLAIVGT